MLVPSVFGRDLFDEFFDRPHAAHPHHELMKTDIKETDKDYEIEIDMPGVSKEGLKAELDNGYLTVSAETKNSKDVKDDNGRYIRRERYSGSFSRSFYVGEVVKEEDIKAKFENGTLKLTVPKKTAEPEIEQKKYIAIEG